MAKEDKFSLFGTESPEAIRRRILGDALAMGQQFAGTAPGRGVVAMGAALPQILGGLFDVGGQQAKAKQIQQIQQESYDEDLGTYYRNLANNLKDIDPQLALRAAEAGAQYDLNKTSKEALANKRVAEAVRTTELLEAERAKLQAQIKELEAAAGLKGAKAEDIPRQTELKEQKQKTDAELRKEELRIKEKAVDDDFQLGADKLLQGETQFDEKMKFEKRKFAWKKKVDKDLLDIRRLKIAADKEIAAGKSTAKSKSALAKANQELLKKFTQTSSDKKKDYATDYIMATIKNADVEKDWIPFNSMSGSAKKQVIAKVKARMTTRLAKDIQAGVGDTAVDLENIMVQEFNAVVAEMGEQEKVKQATSAEDRRARFNRLKSGG